MDKEEYFYYFLNSLDLEREEYDSQKDWLRSISPSAVEAYDEYINDTENKENY